MKTVIVLCTLVLGALAADRYPGLSVSAALQNPGQLLALYEKFSVKESKAKSPERLAIFRNTLQKIAAGNAKHPSWSQGVNKFADMTVDERRSYLGLNASALHRPVPLSAAPVGDVSGSKDWRTEGKVTGVKDQGSCGSCWTFGAVGPIETNYAVISGKRKSFAEKEYLDCVYLWYDGCNGGLYEDCWNYSVTYGRLGLTSDAAYKPKDGRCGRKYKTMHNGLVAAKITGYTTIPPSEDSVMAYLMQGAVGIAFEVTDAFFLYTSGIIKDTTCNDGGSWAANHAVTGVGYTANSMIVKNSWGTAWGMGGYFETARGTDLCEYWRWGALPYLVATGKQDNDPDYVPTEDEDCEGTNADGCACGTVRCNDGQCRHAHMC